MRATVGPLAHSVTLVDTAEQFLQEKQWEHAQIEKQLEGFDLKMYRERLSFLRRLRVSEAAIRSAREDLTRKKDAVRSILDDSLEGNQ